MKTIGILGGLGPHTSSVFYMDIIKKCHLAGAALRPPMLMWSVPSDLEIERAFIATGAGRETFLQYLLQGADRLSDGGADFIAIPCNTVHMHIDALRAHSAIPVLSIVEESIARLKALGIPRAGILATGGTVRDGLYSRALERVGMGIVLPDDSAQARLTQLIHTILDHAAGAPERAELYAILESMRARGADHVLLACTDLQLLIGEDPAPVTLHDTLAILADACVREYLGDQGACKASSPQAR